MNAMNADPKIIRKSSNEDLKETFLRSLTTNSNSCKFNEESEKKSKVTTPK